MLACTAPELRAGAMTCGFVRRKVWARSRFGAVRTDKRLRIHGDPGRNGGSGRLHAESRHQRAFPPLRRAAPRRPTGWRPCGVMEARGLAGYDHLKLSVIVQILIVTFWRGRSWVSSSQRARSSRTSVALVGGLIATLFALFPGPGSDGGGNGASQGRDAAPGTVRPVAHGARAQYRCQRWPDGRESGGPAHLCGECPGQRPGRRAAPEDHAELVRGSGVPLGQPPWRGDCRAGRLARQYPGGQVGDLQRRRTGYPNTGPATAAGGCRLRGAGRQPKADRLRGPP